MILEQHKFANILTVIAKETPEPTRFDVYWKSGVHRQGKVKVDILATISDKRIVAELVAMQHLIDDLEALGNTPAIQGIKLVFSASAVKKVHANRSDKKHLYPYAYYLTTRFAGVTIGVDQDDTWIKPRSEEQVTVIQVDEPPGQSIFVSQLGKVLVTRHVLDKFSQRMNNLEPAQTWRQLSKTLANASLETVVVSQERQEIDGARHASQGIRLADRISRWCFVIAPNRQGRQTIVTAYLR